MAISQCDDTILRRILTGDNDDAGGHLEICPRCQSRLSELAAEEEQWQEARCLLATDPANDQFAAEARERSWSSAIQGSGSSSEAKPAWTEAMARQLLGPPSHPEMLGRLGRYEVERLIGSGGMGIVFKGFDTELNRPVAIKVLAPHLAGSGAARQRFSREARAAAAVVHEHVVAIHNVESEGASPFLVMQYVAGESLQARLDRQGPLALREILRIAHQTAAGLAAAHAQGLVHRDVKPSNILLEQGIERALLTDFGLARAADDASLTHTGYLPGTPHYMSPEQARGDAVDPRSDLFSLGSVMYALCTGRPPFRADTSFGVLRRITDTEPRPIREVNPDIPPWLVTLINRLLAKEPADRFSTAIETAATLEQCLAHVQSGADIPVCLKTTRRARPAQRRPTILAAIMLLLLTGSAAIYFGMVAGGWWSTSTSRGLAPLDRSHPDASSFIAHPSSLSSDWDSTADEIKALSTDVDTLEQRANQLWDAEPTRTTPLNEAPPTNDPSSPEGMP